MLEALQDGYKHSPGAFDSTANGAQCYRKNSWHKSSLTREKIPGYPRLGATRISGNGADKAGMRRPDMVMLEKRRR
jgi:hypothetical protein